MAHLFKLVLAVVTHQNFSSPVFCHSVYIVADHQVPCCCLTHIRCRNIDYGCNFDYHVPVQAAFKRPAATNGPEALAVDSAMDWDAVKPEDRTLIEQARLTILLLYTPLTVYFAICCRPMTLLANLLFASEANTTPISADCRHCAWALLLSAAMSPLTLFPRSRNYGVLSLCSPLPNPPSPPLPSVHTPIRPP